MVITENTVLAEQAGLDTTDAEQSNPSGRRPKSHR